MKSETGNWGLFRDGKQVAWCSADGTDFRWLVNGEFIHAAKLEPRTVAPDPFRQVPLSWVAPMIGRACVGRA